MDIFLSSWSPGPFLLSLDVVGNLLAKNNMVGSYICELG